MYSRLALLAAVMTWSVALPSTDNAYGNVIPIVPKEAKIHGDVLVEGKIVNIAGIFVFGGAGYSQLLDEAKKRYGADAVVNVTLDTRLPYFKLFSIEYEYVLRGIAISYLTR